jgi:hypothetical protein
VRHRFISVLVNDGWTKLTDKKVCSSRVSREKSM